MSNDIRPQALRVLEYLRKWGSDTDSNIARNLEVPAPSVRRSIQELIAHGHNVTFASATGYYTYSTPVETFGGADNA